MTANGRLLTVTEVAELLRVTRGYVERLVAAGDLPAVRLGRMLRFRDRDVNDFIDAHQVEILTGRLGGADEQRRGKAGGARNKAGRRWKVNLR